MIGIESMLISCFFCILGSLLGVPQSGPDMIHDVSLSTESQEVFGDCFKFGIDVPLRA